MRATQAPARAATQSASTGTTSFKEPYSSGSRNAPPEAHSKDKLWEPPARGDIMDKQPQHPHLDETVALKR